MNTLTYNENDKESDMTVSSNPLTDDQDPRRPGQQQADDADVQKTASNASDKEEPAAPPVEPIRRKIVMRSPVTPPPGVRFFGSEQMQGEQARKGISETLLPPSSTAEHGANGASKAGGASGAGGTRATIERTPTSMLPQARQEPVGARSAREQPRTAPLPGPGGANAEQVRQPSALRNGVGAGILSYAPSKTESQQGNRVPEQVVENGNIILYRTHNFFLRTTFRPGQKANPLRKPSGHTTAMPRIMPHQEKRIAASETRLMPNITLNPGKQTKAIPLPAWLEAIIVVIALAGVSVAHAWNMFNFPRYELDEGTYISNAWAITQGMISPYPYGYGHPPLAWIQIAGWLELVGGPFTFGNALNTGRVFMLLVAVACALLVYLIVRRMSGSASAGLLALVIFSFSPLSITYQRQIFLDNIATFWLLVSIYLLVVGRSRLKYLIGSALAYGIMFLSKEVFLVSLPAILFAAWIYTTKFQRKFSMTAYIYTIIAVCSTFVLLAVLKGELFPYSWHLPWDTHPHLSMLDTYLGQVQRGQEGGSFIYSWDTWIENDPVIIILSLAAPLFNLIYGWWNRKHLMLALMSIFFWLLIARGGQVLSYYIIPVIATTALNVAMAVNAILSWPGRVIRFNFVNVVRALLLIGALAVILPYDIQETGFRFYQHPTSAQQDAATWIRNNVPRNSFIVINSYLYLDLRLPGGEGVGNSAPFPHAEVYWNVAYDPELAQQALLNNWDRIDYIVADSEMLQDIKTYGGPMDLIKTALNHSILRAQFSAADHNLQIVVGVYQVIHKFPQPVVQSGPGSGSALAEATHRSQLCTLRNESCSISLG